MVAPPSVHPSGLHLLRERGYRPGHSLARWRRLVKEGIQEGERNSSIASLAVHLFWHGIDPTVVLEPLAVLERAPLPAAAP